MFGAVCVFMNAEHGSFNPVAGCKTSYQQRKEKHASSSTLNGEICCATTQVGLSGKLKTLVESYNMRSIDIKSIAIFFFKISLFLKWFLEKKNESSTSADPLPFFMNYQLIEKSVSFDLSFFF